MFRWWGWEGRERFYNKIFKLSSSESEDPAGAPWGQWVEGQAAEGGGPRETKGRKSELHMTCFVVICLAVGILGKNAFEGRHSLHFIVINKV